MSYDYRRNWEFLEFLHGFLTWQKLVKKRSWDELKLFNDGIFSNNLEEIVVSPVYEPTQSSRWQISLLQSFKNQFQYMLVVKSAKLNTGAGQ